MVGLLIPDIQNDFYSVAARVMAETCAGEGYQLLLAISDDDPDKECRQIQALMRLGAPKPEFGRAALDSLLALPAPPTAIVAGGARLMLGVLEGIVMRRLSVPGDLSVVAYSDSDWFRAWNPQITAVALPVAAMAATAASLLFRQIRHPVEDGPGAHAPFEPVLYVRSSTAPRLGMEAQVKEIAR